MNIVSNHLFIFLHTRNWDTWSQVWGSKFVLPNVTWSSCIASYFAVPLFRRNAFFQEDISFHSSTIFLTPPHLCLVLRLRICGTLSSHPLYTFMAGWLCSGIIYLTMFLITLLCVIHFYFWLVTDSMVQPLPGSVYGRQPSLHRNYKMTVNWKGSSQLLYDYTGVERRDGIVIRAPGQEQSHELA